MATIATTMAPTMASTIARSEPLFTDTLQMNEITTYQVISLLLDGALDRIDQAIGHISAGDSQEAVMLVQKAAGIVVGLRENLDMDNGGEIASNLDNLYEYITHRLRTIDTSTPHTEPLVILREVKNLLQEVHAGWSGISDKVDAIY